MAPNKVEMLHLGQNEISLSEYVEMASEDVVQT
jgi:hypothetical protein